MGIPAGSRHGRRERGPLIGTSCATSSSTACSYATESHQPADIPEALGLDGWPTHTNGISPTLGLS